MAVPCLHNIGKTFLPSCQLQYFSAKNKRECNSRKYWYQWLNPSLLVTTFCHLQTVWTFWRLQTVWTFCRLQIVWTFCRLQTVELFVVCKQFGLFFTCKQFGIFVVCKQFGIFVLCKQFGQTFWTFFHLQTVWTFCQLQTVWTFCHLQTVWNFCCLQTVWTHIRPDKTMGHISWSTCLTFRLYPWKKFSKALILKISADHKKACKISQHSKSKRLSVCASLLILFFSP